MKRKILLNCTPEESRAAVLEGKLLAELHIERTRDRSIVGNIYKARVQRVLPGMQAAFLDVGLEKAAFLHVSDLSEVLEEAVSPETLEAIAEAVDDTVDERAEEAVDEAVEEAVEEAVDEAADPATDDSVDDASAELPEAPSADSDAETEDAEEPASEDPDEGSPRRRKSRQPIEECVRTGQEIVVQVSKEPMGTKGCRVTGYVSLAGRYLVYMPGTTHVGVSRRIEDDSERQRLRDIVVRNRPPIGGFIVRTVCEGVAEKEIRADIKYLTRRWQGVLEGVDQAGAPSLLHSDVDLVHRMVRDHLTNQVGRVIVDDPEEFGRVQELVDSLAPRLRGRIEAWDDDQPLFEHFGVEAQLRQALDPRVRLPSGGYLVIERTEALTSVDVNTGRFVGKKDQEETILRTNLEAATEVVRQLRLRNIGGLIIIDFIDMESMENREQVYDALNECVRETDKAQARILQISELGLVEMTRKRTRETLQKTLATTCPCCNGAGFTLSAEAIADEALRNLRHRVSRSTPETSWVVEASAAVADQVLRSGALASLREMAGHSIEVEVRTDLHLDQYELRSVR